MSDENQSLRTRRAFVQVAQLPIVLVGSQLVSASLWKHALLFYVILIALLITFVWGLVNLWRLGWRRSVAGIALAFLIASLVPIWFRHAAEGPDGVHTHGHTLWRMLHVH